MAFIDRKPGRHRTATIAAVAGLHGMALYGLITGLGVDYIAAGDHPDRQEHPARSATPAATRSPARGQANGRARSRSGDPAAADRPASRAGAAANQAGRLYPASRRTVPRPADPLCKAPAPTFRSGCAAGTPPQRSRRLGDHRRLPGGRTATARRGRGPLRAGAGRRGESERLPRHRLERLYRPRYRHLPPGHPPSAIPARD